MTGQSWFAHLRKASSLVRPVRSVKSRPSFRPRLESLEEKVLPSAVVMQPTDQVPGRRLITRRSQPRPDRAGIRLQSDFVQQRHRTRQWRGRDHRHRRCLRRSQHRQRPDRLRPAVQPAIGEPHQGRDQRPGPGLDHQLPDRQFRLGRRDRAGRRMGTRHRPWRHHPPRRGEQRLADRPAQRRQLRP